MKCQVPFSMNFGRFQRINSFFYTQMKMTIWGRETERLPTTKEQAFQPPLLDLRTGFPLRFTVPSCVYSSTFTTLPSSIVIFIYLLLIYSTPEISPSHTLSRFSSVFLFIFSFPLLFVWSLRRERGVCKEGLSGSQMGVRVSNSMSPSVTNYYALSFGETTQHL